MTDYLTLIEVVAIHADQIARFGGLDGIRDKGVLEAALFRPQTGYYADPIEQAAALERFRFSSPLGRQGEKSGAYTTYVSIGESAA
jgi:hypothetical protein